MRSDKRELGVGIEVMVKGNHYYLSTKSNNKGLYYSELLCSALCNRNRVCICYDERLKS